MVGRVMPIIVSPFSKWELIRSLVKRDLLSRYTGSFLGFFWAFIQPVAMVIIYYFVCSLVFRLSLKGSSYNFFEFLVCGLLPWLAFSESISRSCNAIVEQGYMVKKVFFPSEILVPVVVLSSMTHLMVGCGVFVVYVFLAKLHVLKTYWWHLLLLPLPFALQLMFSVGLGWFVAAINVFWRDVGHVLSLAITVWFYATPIVYPYDLVPEVFKVPTNLNPLFCLIESYRWVLLGDGRFGVEHGLYLFVVSLAFYVFGGFIFGKLKEDFASVL